MSLAARCPACGTVFRVVQDQLRVSEGWVRCGRCAEVFNAIESLVDVDTVATVSNPPLTQRSSINRVIEDLARTAGVDERETPPPVAPETERQPAPADTWTGPAPGEPVAAAIEPDLRADAADPPAFIRQAERAARWQRPGVRAVLSVAALAAAFALASQATFEYRDWVAARWPATRPLLDRACATLGCRIEPPRAIESLAVESSGLVRIEGTAMYRLSVVLRNRASLALALPAVDLSLTDSQGATIARRVVAVADLGPAQSQMPASGELALQGTISVGERAISGYTIEIFYP